MSGIENLGLFLISGLLLNLIPGPDTIYIVSRSAGRGFWAGLTASLGTSAGILLHVFAAAFGMSAILSASATAFTVVKILGCAYLLWMGLNMIFSRREKAAGNNETEAKKNPAKHLNITSKKKDSFFKIFLQGFLTNALNPKVALFFLAFVPQFISPQSTEKTLAFLILGLLFMLVFLLYATVMVGLSASAGKKVKTGSKFTFWIKKFAGGLFVFFAIKLAFSRIN